MINLVKKFILFLGDWGLFYFSLFITLLARRIPENWGKLLAPFSVVFVFWTLIFYGSQLYELKPRDSKLNLAEKILKASVINLFLSASFFYIIPYFHISSLRVAPKTILILVLLISSILVFLWREIFWQTFQGIKARKKTIIVGRNKKNEKLLQEILQKDPNGLGSLVFIKGRPEEFRNISSEKFATLVVNGSLDEYQNILRFIPEDILWKSDILSFSEFYEAKVKKIPLGIINHEWLVKNISGQEKEFYNFLKQVLDILLALSLALFFIPPAIAIFLLILICDRQSPIFRQKRVGKNGRVFSIFKFRTMKGRTKEGTPYWTTKADKRITKLGKVLRLSHLDEIPQIINILKGDMSFVGPRPERPELVKSIQKETPFYRLRHLIKPGLTGWAQINYFYADSIKQSLEKLQYDLYYLKNRTLVFDLIILVKTLGIVLGTEGR